MKKCSLQVCKLMGALILIMLVALYCRLIVTPAAAPTISSVLQKAVFTQDVNYVPGQSGVRGFLATPAIMDHRPAVILIHEWWGLNDNMRTLAQQFAQEGYVALAVDLYDGKLATTPDEAREYATYVRENPSVAFTNLAAAVKYLKSLPNVDPDRIGSVGWCFGGQWAYEMAKGDLGTQVSVMYYGRFSPADDLNHMKSLILGHFGEKDASISVDDVRQFQATLKTLSGDHEVYIYPNAGHGFANESNPNYDEKSAIEAWKRTTTFLEEHL